jgi:hypothetical protein
MKFTGTLLRIINQLRIYHWLCDTYAQHKAYGEAYDELSDLVDTFLETYMGKYGKASTNITFSIELTSSTANSSEFIDSAISFLTKINDIASEEDTDLLNIRDEMLGELNKLKYLLTLT